MQRKYRIISVHIILTLIISMISVFAFADTASEQENETLSSIKSSAVERTYAFGILSDSDLTLTASESITRAEFCVWAVKLLGMENYKFGNFRYTDVPDDYWAADYINTACSMKLVSESDKFNPDMPIRFDEAVKILVVASSYEPAASQYGGWPSGYITAASKNGITNGVSSKGGTVTRKDAVRMIDNTLDVKVLDTKYNQTFEQSDRTVLSEYLNIDVYSGKILEVDVKERRVKAEIDGSADWYALSKSIDTAFVIEDEADIYIYNERSGRTIVYIDFKGTLSVSYDYISEINESAAQNSYSSGEVKKVYLLNEDKEYSVEPDANITLNDIDAAEAPVMLNGAFAKIIKDDNRICKIQAYSLYEGGIIYRADPTKLKYIHGDVNDNVLEDIDTIDELQIYIDGILHTDMYDLKADMVFDYYISPDEDKLIIVASSRSYAKNLDYTTGDSLVLDGVQYDISKSYGLYVYSNAKQRYQKDDSLDGYLGKKINVYVDDSKCVRYVKIGEEIESANSFVGVVMQVSTGDNVFDDNEARIKIFKITGGQGEKIYETEPKKMEKSTIKMDYIRENAGNTEGKSFLKFTLNDENKIIKVEPVELWGSKMIFSGSISKTAEYWIKNLYTRSAVIFAAFYDDGEFKVRTVDWDKNMRDITFDSKVTVISDYDPMYNPKPNYVMLGTGSETHRTGGAEGGYIEEINELPDDMVQIVFNNTWGNKKYTITKEYFNTLGLKENMMVQMYTDLFTDKQIMVNSKRDLSVSPELWENDNAKFNSGTREGFFKADKIMYRDKNVAQFMVNGEVTDLYALNSYCCVYELVRGKNGTKLVRKKGSTTIGYINSSDNVWFNLIPWGPEPRSIEYIIYEKTSIAGN